MLNIIWEHIVDATNCNIEVTINSVTETCSLTYKTYKGLDWLGSGSMMGTNSLMAGLAAALTGHSEAGGANANASFERNTSNAGSSAYPYSWINLIVHTADSDVTLEWGHANTTATPADFGFGNGDATFTAVGTTCVITPPFNSGFYWVPLHGCNNAAIDLNTAIIGTQTVAAGGNTEAAFATRVLNTVQTGAIFFDIVPDGYIRTYRNTEPGSFFAATAKRASQDTMNTIDRLLEAASRNETFTLVKNRAEYLDFKVPPPWDTASVATYSAGGRMYCAVTINLRVIE